MEVAEAQKHAEAGCCESSTMWCLNAYNECPSCVENYIVLWAASMCSRLSSALIHEHIGYVMQTGKFKPLIHNLVWVTAAFCFGFELATPFWNPLTDHWITPKCTLNTCTCIHWVKDDTCTLAHWHCTTTIHTCALFWLMIKPGIPDRIPGGIYSHFDVSSCTSRMSVCCCLLNLSMDNNTVVGFPDTGGL